MPDSNEPVEFNYIRKSLFKLEGYAESQPDRHRLFLLREIEEVRRVLNIVVDDYFTEVDDCDPRSMGWVGDDRLP